ncbi:MAG: DsbA family protein [Nitrospirota bacterium]
MRIKLLPAMIVCLFFISSIASAGDNSSIRGVHKRLPDQKYNYDGKKVEVIEFLSFYCGHCYQFEKSIPVIKGNFPKKIEWKTVPIYWGKGSPKPAEAYLLAREAGKGEQMKKALFRTIFVEKKDIGDVTVLEDIGIELGLGFDFSRRLRAGDKAKEAADAMQMAKEYRINSTPTLIIAGNIMTSPDDVGHSIDAFRDNAIAILISILKL